MGNYRKFSEQEEAFLLERLRKEWLAVERAEKLHNVAQLAKKGGVVAAKALLTFAVIAGVVSVAGIAPNAFAAYGKLTGGARRRFYQARIFKKELRGLQRRGFVRVQKTSHGYDIEATKHGRIRALRNVASNLAIQKSGKWDGTWWVVMFDIPRRHNAERNALRERLKQIGMESLQASVFVSRYPCAEEVWFTARLFSAEQYVTIAHVDAFEGHGRKFTKSVDA